MIPVRLEHVQQLSVRSCCRPRSHRGVVCIPPKRCRLLSVMSVASVPDQPADAVGWVVEVYEESANAWARGEVTGVVAGADDRVAIRYTDGRNHVLRFGDDRLRFLEPAGGGGGRGDGSGGSSSGGGDSMDDEVASDSDGQLVISQRWSSDEAGEVDGHASDSLGSFGGGDIGSDSGSDGVESGSLTVSQSGSHLSLSRSSVGMSLAQHSNADHSSGAMSTSMPDNPPQWSSDEDDGDDAPSNGGRAADMDASRSHASRSHASSVSRRSPVDVDVDVRRHRRDSGTHSHDSLDGTSDSEAERRMERRDGTESAGSVGRDVDDVVHAAAGDDAAHVAWLDAYDDDDDSADGHAPSTRRNGRSGTTARGRKEDDVAGGAGDDSGDDESVVGDGRGRVDDVHVDVSDDDDGDSSSTTDTETASATSLPPLALMEGQGFIDGMVLACRNLRAIGGVRADVQVKTSFVAPGSTQLMFRRKLELNRTTVAPRAVDPVWRRYEAGVIGAARALGACEGGVVVEVVIVVVLQGGGGGGGGGHGVHGHDV